MLDRGFTLVSDDQTIVKKAGDRLIATAPPTISGKLEIRGIGIVELDCVADVPIALIVELTTDITRMPDDSRERTILGVPVPLVSIDAMTASAASKVEFALERTGLKF
jgi:serine kinase of HPr protein (carbohydrate metabolism regulator)